MAEFQAIVLHDSGMLSPWIRPIMGTTKEELRESARAVAIGGGGRYVSRIEGRRDGGQWKTLYSEGEPWRVDPADSSALEAFLG